MFPAGHQHVAMEKQQLFFYAPKVVMFDPTLGHH